MSICGEWASSSMFTEQARGALERGRGQGIAGGAARESEASSSTARGGTRSDSKPQCYQAYFENMGRGMER